MDEEGWGGLRDYCVHCDLHHLLGPRDHHWHRGCPIRADLLAVPVPGRQDAEHRAAGVLLRLNKNGGALQFNSEHSHFFNRDVRKIIETYMKLDYSLHTLIELLEQPRDMKRFVIL